LANVRTPLAVTGANAGATASNKATARIRLMSFFMNSLLWWMGTRVQGYRSRRPRRTPGATAELAREGRSALDARRPLG
jgi:hypothetical protein